MIVRFSFVIILISILFLTPVAAQDGDNDNPVTLLSDSTSSDTMSLKEVQSYYDSSHIQGRVPDGSRFDKYLNDDDYRYDRTPSPDRISLFERLLAALRNKLFFVNGESGTWFFRIIEWVLIAVAVILLGMLLAKANTSGLLYGSRKKIVINSEEIEENIHEVNLEKLLNESIAAKNYRRAVRYLFLGTLKKLTDKGHILWMPSKTNRTYLRELHGTPLAQPMAGLVLLFDYVWYGDFEVDEQSFPALLQQFNEFTASIKQKESAAAVGAAQEVLQGVKA